MKIHQYINILFWHDLAESHASTKNRGSQGKEPITGDKILHFLKKNLLLFRCFVLAIAYFALPGSAHGFDDTVMHRTANIYLKKAL